MVLTELPAPHPRPEASEYKWVGGYTPGTWLAAARPLGWSAGKIYDFFPEP